MSARHDQEGAPHVGFKGWNHAPEPIELPRAQAVQHPEAPVALGSVVPGHVENHHLQNRGKRRAGESPSPTPLVHIPPLGGLCASLPSPGAQRQTSSHSARALEQKGEGRLTFIFRLSCLKAFTPSPPLTPLPCRIDSGCDMVQVISRRCSAPFVRRGAAKTRPKAAVLLAGYGAEPQRKLSSIRNGLQF